MALSCIIFTIGTLDTLRSVVKPDKPWSLQHLFDTFVMPSSVADDAIRQSGGSISKLEELLGLKPGDLGTNPVRIDIENPKGLRMPSGNERGTNPYWIPGGYTSGGIKEAVIDSPVEGEYTVKPMFLGE